MRLSKLELYGFKSFAKKTEIVFGDGVTAVIGPNGSGKSNIADAIKWVLGEQSAKALRGGRMEDVIFSGTEQRKAQAYCEVTLTFENTDRKLNLDFNEVAVTRRVYRSGDSEYCINSNACRLRDIQELFRDTGIGKDGYSIIGQGRVDEILSNRSNERRAALEEAAGVMRYRVRKEEAERKLDNTEKNLERIEDILNELTARLEPLKEQSASARTYLKLRDELKDHEVNLFLYQYDKNTERLALIRQSIAEMREESANAAGTEQVLLAQCASLEEQVRFLDSNLTVQQNRLMELLSGVEAHVGESRVLHERRESARREADRLTDELKTNGERTRHIRETLDGFSSDDARQQAILRMDAGIAETEQSLTAIDGSIDEAEEALEALKQSIIEAMNRASDYRSDVSRLNAMREAILNRLTSIGDDEQSLDSRRKQLGDELHEAEEARRASERAIVQAKDAVNEAIRHRDDLRSAYQEAQETVSGKEQALASTRSRLHVLSEMAKSREGYYQSVRNVMREREKNTALSRAIIGVVAELIRVPKEYEQAITMALGSSIQNIVTPTAEDAKLVIEYLRRNDFGRATLLPIALLNPSRIDRRERELLSMDGVIGVASELISFDESIRTAAEYLLGRTVIVRDLDSGIALKKRSHGAFHIASLDGDIISASGSMSGGSANKRGYSLLGREREIQELTGALAELERALLKLKNEQTARERELLLLDVQVEGFRTELHERELSSAKQVEQLEIIRRDVANLEEAYAELREEREQLNENLSDIDRQSREAEASRADAEEGGAASREDVIGAQNALAALRAERERISAELTDKKVRRMALKKEQDAVTDEISRLNRELLTLESARSEMDAALSEQLAAVRSIDEAVEGMLGGIAEEQRNADEQKARGKQMEEERTKLGESLSELRLRREKLLASARDLAERIHRQELSENRLEMECNSMQDHIWSEYELTYENAAGMRHEIFVGATQSRIAEIRDEIRSLGDVNLSSIEDYQTVLERHTALSAQCSDLHKAEEDLRTLIGELTGTMERVFAEQFTVMQKNFAEVFAELFGGGHAELRLSDRRDALNCDIDIIAQPPGKKLQLLSLLSGGERALTAIALLFAMLKLKAPAFCILDEIESSLDEVNVTRFANYVKAYSDETQFILITHRKGSMEVCNSLYGVSMEEKGISKIVSARFGEAIK